MPAVDAVLERGLRRARGRDRRRRARTLQAGLEEPHAVAGERRPGRAARPGRGWWRRAARSAGGWRSRWRGSTSTGPVARSTPADAGGATSGRAPGGAAAGGRRGCAGRNGSGGGSPWRAATPTCSTRPVSATAATWPAWRAPCRPAPGASTVRGPPRHAWPGILARGGIGRETTTPCALSRTSGARGRPVRSCHVRNVLRRVAGRRRAVAALVRPRRPGHRRPGLPRSGRLRTAAPSGASAGSSPRRHPSTTCGGPTTSPGCSTTRGPTW